jgi:isoleucyl-tRNA synthetase
VRKVKPNFAKLGKQYGPRMKEVAAVINTMTKEQINILDKSGKLALGGFDLAIDDVIINSEDIPGWAVAAEGGLTVALDITITEELRQEGVARDFVNRIQNLRKDRGLEVLDKIVIQVQRQAGRTESLEQFRDYISTETQAQTLSIQDEVKGGVEVDMDDFVLLVNMEAVS